MPVGHQPGRTSRARGGSAGGSSRPQSARATRGHGGRGARRPAPTRYEVTSARRKVRAPRRVGSRAGRQRQPTTTPPPRGVQGSPTGCSPGGVLRPAAFGRPAPRRRPRRHAARRSPDQRRPRSRPRAPRTRTRCARTAIDRRSRARWRAPRRARRQRRARALLQVDVRQRHQRGAHEVHAVRRTRLGDHGPQLVVGPRQLAERSVMRARRSRSSVASSGISSRTTSSART